MEDLLNSDKSDLLYNESYISTYQHYNDSGTNPDLTFASADISDVTEREVIYDPGSGHHMIVTTFNFNTKKSLGHSVRHRWNLTKANWNAFTLNLESTFGSSFRESGESIDCSFSKFTKIIFETAKKWILRGKQFKFKPFWNENLAILK
ncbi:hypothetical protein TNCV_3004971 [Trichonephila clavipes]|nr:hypothetical protein TNCV_3004971 [Trichonephila clavipes]